MPDAVRYAALALSRVRNADFGPTLAAEKLAELHGIAQGRETLAGSPRGAPESVSSLVAVKLEKHSCAAGIGKAPSPAIIRIRSCLAFGFEMFGVAPRRAESAGQARERDAAGRPLPASRQPARNSAPTLDWHCHARWFRRSVQHQADVEPFLRPRVLGPAPASASVAVAVALACSRR